VTFWADPYDLHHLRDTIYYLADEKMLGHAVYEFLLELAYEVGMGWERRGLTQTFGHDDLDTVTYHGGRMLWPFFLVQVSLLRRAASYLPTTAAHQADLYRLESGAESALMQYNAEVGERCLSMLHSVGDFPRGYLASFIWAQGREYVTGVGGHRRFARLPGLLRRLYWLGDDYRAYADDVATIAQQKGCEPEDLEDAGDWPKFRW
jgi:hypothetical protein